MSKEKPKILSLFSGAGGLDLGFRNAGFDIVTSNEIDSDTFETYEYNFPKTNISGPIVNNQIRLLSQKSTEAPAEKFSGIQPSCMCMTRNVT